MRENYEKKKCVFCDPLGPQNVVIDQHGNWRIWNNPFPVGKAKAHWIMAPVRHLLGHPIGLVIGDFHAMGQLFINLVEKSAKTFGFAHEIWECHIIVPDLTGSVQFMLGPQLLPITTYTLGDPKFSLFDWRLVENPNKMPHTAHHFLFEKDNLDQEDFALTVADFDALGELFHDVVDEYGIQGGGFIIADRSRTKAFLMRFGSVKYNEGSVLHQHANVIVSNPDEPAFGLTLGKDEKKLTEGLARMLVFENLRRGIPFEALNPEQQELVKDRIK